MHFWVNFSSLNFHQCKENKSAAGGWVWIIHGGWFATFVQLHTFWYRRCSNGSLHFLLYNFIHFGMSGCSNGSLHLYNFLHFDIRGYSNGSLLFLLYNFINLDMRGVQMSRNIFYFYNLIHFDLSAVQMGRYIFFRDMRGVQIKLLKYSWYRTFQLL